MNKCISLTILQHLGRRLDAVKVQDVNLSDGSAIAANCML
jgi:hypothetical protein